MNREDVKKVYIALIRINVIEAPYDEESFDDYLEHQIIEEIYAEIFSDSEPTTKYETSDAKLNIGCVNNCYIGDCLIQDSCFSFKTKRCNKDCKSYQ